MRINYLSIMGLLLLLGCSSKEVSEFDFKIQNPDQIHRIDLTHPSGEKVMLTRSGDHWIINGGSRVRDNAMENLLDVLTRVELKFIPVYAAQKAMQEDIARQGVEVQVMDEKSKILAHYFVGGMTPDERGTYMRQVSSETPVVTSMAGWEGGLRIRYWMPVIEWMDRTIFRASVSEISEVAITYHDQPQKSFKLIRDGEGDFLSVGTQNREKFKVAQAAMDRYLVAFQHIGAEALIDHEDLVGMSSDLPPWCQITLKTSEEYFSYAVYSLDLEPTARGSIKRYHFIDTDGEVFLVQDALVKELFLGYNFFYDHKVP